MDSLFASEQFLSETLSGTTSLEFLLKHGLNTLQRGDYVAGAALLSLARTLLRPQQELAAVLDTFLQGYRAYQQIQQALHEMSIQYSEAYRAQQAYVADLERCLPQFMKDMSSIDSTPAPQEREEVSNEARYALITKAVSQDISAFSPGAAVPSPPSPLAALSSPPINEDGTSADLYITCFGHFEVRHLNRQVPLCSSRNGQGILRYLITRSEHSASSEMLQTLFWPDDTAEIAQRKLHNAISALRRSFKHGMAGQADDEYIVYKNRTYYFNSPMPFETDVSHFLHYYSCGQQKDSDRIDCYERACRYYTGPFLMEDLYADWSFLQREQLSRIYLGMCRVLAAHYLHTKRYENATRWVTILLEENHCDEDAHRLLIQIYAAQGRRNEALQHYHRCVRLLKEVLGVQPLPETRALYSALQAPEPTEWRIEKI
ncbi:MAG TPA: BTAD domain-containing putative transcriptional regulator [Ktedonobacteraceae bacterium]|nr:BTAD domain-containing putative transcriptional regulator [Ktedonobacteraceae bacterium]